MSITYNAETQVIGCRELVVRIGKFSEIPLAVPHDIDLREYINADFLYPNCFPKIEVFANGYDCDTEGFVCVRFYNITTGIIVQNLAGLIELVDAEGNRRFPQSFSDNQVFLKLECHPYSPGKFISRSVLLNEPLEFIPGDTLTLHIELNVESKPFLKRSPDGQKWVLRLDSEFGKRLWEESQYFGRLLMEAHGSRDSIAFFPREEHHEFRKILTILCCSKTYLIFGEIFPLYKTADKYGIPLVVDFCRKCLELSLTPETAPEILEFAEEFHDDCLRETVETFYATDWRLPDKTQLTIRSRATRMDYEWKFKRKTGWNTDTVLQMYDMFRHNIKIKAKKKENDHQFVRDTYEYYH